MEKVDKWCTYGVWGRLMPDHLGKLIELDGNGKTGVIKYSDGQLYAPEYWDMTYVQVFDKIEDAIYYLATQGRDHSIHSIREYFPFSKTGGEIDWDKLLQMEKEYYDKIYARRKKG
jgi:hypothetical protein